VRDEKRTLLADGKFEWEGENHVALFIRDDKCPAVRFMSIMNSLAHVLASRLRNLIACRVQVVELE